MIKYRPEIDGLRTVAVLPVILFHLGFDWISGGYLGVDVFFVISGFLITSIIFKKLELGTFTFKGFWLRRIKRIMPALFFLTTTTLMVGPFLIFKGDIVYLAKDALSAIFSYANFNAWLSFGDYWGNRAESSFFLHSWALSLEEQFYIVYPAILYLCYKKKLSLSKVISLIFAASFFLFIIGVLKFPTPTFYMLPTRAWQLSCGGLLGVIRFKQNIEFKNIKLNTFFVGLGLMMIFISYFAKADGVIDFITILPTIGASLIIYYSSKKEFFGRLLSNHVVVLIGKMSYSLYLWHWVIIVLLKVYYTHLFSNAILNLIATILTIVMSSISYFIVEKKTRTNKKTLMLVFLVFLFNLGLVFLINSKAVVKEYNTKFNKVAFYGLKYDITPQVSVPSVHNLAKRKGIFAPSRENKHIDAYKKEGIIVGNEKLNHPEIIVIGDSHGAMWAKVLAEITDELKTKTSFYTSVGVSPFFSLNNKDIRAVKGFSKAQRIKYAEQLVSNIKLWQPKLLIISCRWENMSSINWNYFCDFVKMLNKYEVNIIVLNQPPVINMIGDRNSSQYLSFLNYKPNGGKQYISVNENNKLKIKNNEIELFSNKNKNVKHLDVYSSYSLNDKVLVINNDDIYYYDDDHLSYQGTKLVKQKLKEFINDFYDN